MLINGGWMGGWLYNGNGGNIYISIYLPTGLPTANGNGGIIYICQRGYQLAWTCIYIYIYIW